MTAKLTLYSRKNCCLCDEMKAAVREVGETMPIELAEIDVDSSVELQEKFGDQVPVLLIDGRKAFKYRVTASALEKKLTRKRPSFLSRLTRSIGKN